MDVSKIVTQLQGGLINQGGFLTIAIEKFLQKVIEEEFEKFIRAKEYERTDERRGYRNGSYERALKTRVGNIMLHVCRDRDGEFQTALFEKYQRWEKALVGTIAEMYFSGISTRKVSGIMEELCGFSVSKSQVSNLVAALDIDLQKWRERLLTAVYRYLIFDARYEKVRENGVVVSKAYVTAIGITSEGRREIIGCWVINSESYEAWETCINSLKERGLTGVEYIVTDENKGLRKALMKHFQGVLLQRCQVHYMRNFLAKLGKSEQQEALLLLRDVFDAPTKEEAKQRIEKVKTFLETKKKKGVIDWLEDTIEETLTVFELPIAHRKKMKSTNMLERFNQELKRRSKVVRIFPNEASCLRLLGSLCQEMSELWAHRIYLTMEV